MNAEKAQEELELWRKVVSDYFLVKKLIIKAENIDKEKRIPLNSINELRNALDHIMRVLAKKYNLYEGEVDIHQNLMEALEHIYRAGYDACDIIAITFLEEIEKLLEPYPTDAILKVWSNFYDEWYPKLEEAKKAIEEAKRKKGNWEGFKSEYFKEYLEKIEILEELLNELKKRIAAIHKSYEELKKREFKEKSNTLLLAVATIIGGVIGALITAFFTFLKK